jgi:hypothetical protein
MGSLIFLLVVIARQVRLQSTALGNGQYEKTIEELESAKEMKDWYLDELQASKEKSSKLLEQAHARLGHLDDQIARQKKEIELLQKAIAALESFQGEEEEAKEKLQRKLAIRKEQLEEAEAELEELRKEIAHQPRSYSIVPYQGSHGTFRRPIYLECIEDRIVLQPEGITFQEEDFLAAFHPEAPMKAAMRAVRHYLHRNGIVEAKTQPYPLLLVRPSGIKMYYKARAALGSLGTDFGYELIEEDWPLDYPAEDEELRKQVLAKVEDARRRTRALAHAAPSLFEEKPKSKPVYGVAANGTPVLLEGETSKGGRDNPPGRSSRDSLSFSNQKEEVTSDAGRSSAQASRPQPPMIGSTHPRQPFSDSGRELGGVHSGTVHAESSRDSRGPQGETPDLFGPTEGETLPRYSGVPPASRNDGVPSASADVSRSPYPNDSSGSAFPDSPEGQLHAGDPGMGQGLPSNFQTNANPETLADTSGCAPDMSPHQPPSLPTPTFQDDQRNVTPLASSQGTNWGLPGYSSGAFGISRPILLHCTAEQLILLEQPGTKEEKRFALDSSTRSAVQELVPALWNCMESWGMAGQGMYWKPLLKVSVAPGGEPHFQQIKQLLHESGINVERR